MVKNVRPSFSVRDLLSYLKLRTVIITEGVGFTSKIRLIFWAFFDSIPRTVMRRTSSLKYYVNHIKEWMINGTMINLDGNKFYCIDSDSLWVLLNRFESWMWSHLNLGEGDVFVDVGAHIGKYTVQVAKMVGENGLVIALEPHPKTIKRW